MSTVLTLDTRTIVIRSSCEINLLISQAAVGYAKSAVFFTELLICFLRELEDELLICYAVTS